MIYLGAIIFMLWVWAILNITQSRFIKPTWQTFWLIFVVFIPLIGSLAYLVLRKKLITKEKRKFQPKFKIRE